MSNTDPRLSGQAVARVVFDEPAIMGRVKELAREITAAYPDGDLLVLGLLKGCFIFLSDLVRHILRPLGVDFLVAASYGDGTVTLVATSASCTTQRPVSKANTS